MSNNLTRLAHHVFNQPLLVREAALDALLSVIGPRILAGTPIEPGQLAAAAPDPRQPQAFRGEAGMRFRGGGYLASDGVAVLPILGAMVRRGSWLDAMCDVSSYQAIGDAATEILMNPQVRGLILELDTPGGHASGIFDLRDLIHNMAAVAGKPVWAHANEEADSAGYLLACAAEQIWVATTAEVGSIGVVCAHVDVSGADAKAGHKWTYVHAGEGKVDGNPHEPLSDSARAQMKANADELYEMFIGVVSAARGLSTAEIHGIKAHSYRGSKAIEVGLADKLGTLDEAIAAMAAELATEETPGNSRAAASKFRSEAMAGNGQGASAPRAEGNGGNQGENAPEPTNQPASAPVQPQPAPEPAPAPPQPAPADPAAAAAAAETARCAELAAISTQAAALGVKFDLSAAISGRVTAAAARQTVLEAAASRDQASAATPGYVPRAATGQGAGQSTMSKEDKRGAWGKSLKRP